jgi:hypothetical protein
MECQRCLLDLKREVMTPPLFLSGSETRSVACDGQNGMRFPHGPGLVPPGDRSLAHQNPPSIRHEFLTMPGPWEAALVDSDVRLGVRYGHQCGRSLAPVVLWVHARSDRV